MKIEILKEINEHEIIYFVKFEHNPLRDKFIRVSKGITENKTSSPAIESISLEQNPEIIDSNQNLTFLKTFAIKIFNLIEVALGDISRALIRVNQNFTNISKILEDLKNGQFK